MDSIRARAAQGAGRVEWGEERRRGDFKFQILNGFVDIVRVNQARVVTHFDSSSPAMSSTLHTRSVTPAAIAGGTRKVW